MTCIHMTYILQCDKHIQFRGPRLARLFPMVKPENILDAGCGCVQKDVFVVDGRAVFPQ